MGIRLGITGLLLALICNECLSLSIQNRPDTSSHPRAVEISRETLDKAKTNTVNPPIQEDVGRRTFLAVSSVSVLSLVGITIAGDTLFPEIVHAHELVSISSPLSLDDTRLNTETLASASATPAIDWKPILEKAGKKALGGGKAGAAAAVVQVGSLMWLRTLMNYQYRYGGTLKSSLDTLWEQGGIARLYQGLPFALIQGPMTRFGDTAANVGILALLETIPEARELPLPIKTACGSAAAGLWRIVLMPVDASKTAMQVEGQQGLQTLWQSVITSGPGPLYQGALAQAAATAVGHFPWFVTYNTLNEKIPAPQDGDLLLTLVRSAFLGLAASCVSDCTSNSLRVIKTTKQTAQLNMQESSSDGKKKDLSYGEVVAMIVEKDGLIGLFGRGLQTRLLINAIQGSLFSVMWKYFQQVGGM